MQKVLGVANSLLKPLGVTVAPLSSMTLRNAFESSIEAIVSELARFEGDDVLANLSLSAGRGLPQFSWGESGTHPFIEAARAGLEHTTFDNARAAVTASLAGFYASYQPRALHEVFWPVSETPGILANYPAWSVMMPWQGGDDIDSWMQKVTETVWKEGRRGKGRLSINDGWSWSGPVSPEKLNLEATRLTQILRAVKKRGYRRHDGFDGDIRAIVLVDADGGWSWQSYAGQHRAAVLSALGSDRIPVRVSGLVRAHDVLTWPQVTNGLYTADQARHIFNQVFAATRDS